MIKAKNISGEKFGKLTAIKPIEKRGNQYYWLCECECGNTKIARCSHLLAGDVKSCGCLQIQKATTHGLSKTRLYKIYSQMKIRCLNPKNPAYKSYGGRGIKICKEWLKDFKVFYSWAMENGYNDTLSIDRIDVNGNYEPNNCRWVDMKTQCNNRRSNELIEFKGVKHSIAEWAEIYKIKKSVLWARLKKLNWPFEKAIAI
jgi:hypothetical protein